MNIIEKIRAEVERMKNDSVHLHTYDELLSFLSTLEKEEKPSEGLEEEIYNYANTIAEGTPLFEIIPQTARHFAQWQKEQMMKESVEGEYDKYPAAIYLEVPIPRMNQGDKVRIIIV